MSADYANDCLASVEDDGSGCASSTHDGKEQSRQPCARERISKFSPVSSILRVKLRKTCFLLRK